MIQSSFLDNGLNRDPSCLSYVQDCGKSSESSRNAAAHSLDSFLEE